MTITEFRSFIMGNIGIWQLLIVAVIVVLLFGTKKLRNIGGDLGSAIKGFKSAVSDEKTDGKDDKNSDEMKDVQNEQSSSIADKSTTASSSSVKEKDQV